MPCVRTIAAAVGSYSTTQLPRSWVKFSGYLCRLLSNGALTSSNIFVILAVFRILIFLLLLLPYFLFFWNDLGSLKMTRFCMAESLLSTEALLIPVSLLSVRTYILIEDSVVVNCALVWYDFSSLEVRKIPLLSGMAGEHCYSVTEC